MGRHVRKSLDSRECSLPAFRSRKWNADIAIGIVLFFLFAAGCDTFDNSQEDLRQVDLANILTGEPDIALNPNGITPLAAEITIRSDNPTTVSFEVLGNDPLRQASDQRDTLHVVPILGLYPGVENQVALRIEDAEVGYALDTLTIGTDPLPEAFPSIEVTVARESAMEPGLTLSEISVANGAGEFTTYPTLFDANGDVRWYLDLEFLRRLAFPIRRLENGNLLLSNGSEIFEYDMLGNRINTWQVPGAWQHHEVVEMPSGNFLVAVDKFAVTTTEDHIYELDRQTGAVVREWDLRRILDVDRYDLVENQLDWFHMNAIYYDAEHDALIISGRNQGVVKVSGNNELIWILAPHRGWGRAGVDSTGHQTSEFLLTAVDESGNPYPDDIQQGVEAAEDFDWTWGQHAAMLLPNGNLFVFDNGFNRHFADQPVSYSRGVEYEINEDDMTVRQVWQYGEERGSLYYSAIISDVDYLPGTGNRLIMPGIVNDPDSRAFVTEVTYPAGEVVFEAVIDFKNLLGAGAGWGEIDMVYRSGRMLLYPNSRLRIAGRARSAYAPTRLQIAQQ